MKGLRFGEVRMKKGSIFGGAFLLAGSCIGAGMLALPVITGLAGVLPSLIMLVIAWLFMLTSGLFLLEANLNLGYQYSLISLSELTLGQVGKKLTWVLFCFLFYSLNIAYVSASGQILQGFLHSLGFHLSYDMACVFFAAFFGFIVYRGTKAVDFVNRALMVFLILSYLILVFLGVKYVNTKLWALVDFKYALPTLPILIISFGFQNMIPSLAHYFAGDFVRLKKAVIIGSAIPFVIYLIWELVLLGIIPEAGRQALKEAVDQGKAISQVLQNVIGYSFLTMIAQGFALFAIITSYVAQALSLVDFLSDGLRVVAIGRLRVYLVLLVIFPPLLLALLKPGLFITALNYAGGFSAVILFGLFPVLMVWKLRYFSKQKGKRAVPFGKISLITIAALSMLIFIVELISQISQ